MRSSISSSDSPPQWPEAYWQRPIPSAHWRAVGLMTLLIVCVFFACWEAFWRSEDYGPSYEATKELWTLNREKVGRGQGDQTVTVGSSRILFDFDLDMWRQAMGGERPTALAIAGKGPLPVLHDLAMDESFKGTLICGVTEALFFLPPPAPPVAEAAEFVRYSKFVSPARRAGLYLSVPFESGFASLNKEDLSLAQLIKRWLPLKNRKDARIMPPLPPYIASIEFDWRNEMWKRMEVDPVLQQKVQQVWLPWFLLGPPLGGPPLEGLLHGVAEDVSRIRERGGQVVFVRCPSTDQLREIERERWPREAYWNRLLEVTGAPGIHFEDHEELMEFDCPEWSHLTQSDAVSFTRRLARIYREEILAQGN